MARKSRKEKIALINAQEHTVPELNKKIYNTGLYARKSCPDLEGKDEGDSIQTQISMLERYIDKHSDLELYDIYVDNGETGTNFDRPQFDRMMDDIRKGNVNCVVVKDLSRFGRNYMESGRLIETVFPYMGVRFIAVNEGYDSISKTASNDNISISVKNLLNDFYAKDISNKINSAYTENFKLGKFMGAYAPYGYLKDADNPYRFVVDKNTAPIVVKIFKMKADGMKYQAIADYLNCERIESPVNYKYRIGILKDKCFADKKAWGVSAIKQMLCNQAYIGNMVQGKRQCRNSANRKDIFMREHDWFVVENTHEAIIDKSLWDKVQVEVQRVSEIYRKRNNKYADRFQSENILLKKLICTECGKYLRRGHQCKKDYIIYSYYCSSIHQDGTKCTCRYHNEKKLFAVILDAIKQQIKLAVDSKELLIEFEKMSDFNYETEKLKKELSVAENKLKKTKSKKVMLYNDHTEGLINRDDYETMYLQYQREIEEQTEVVESLILQLYKNKNYKTKENPWIIEFEKFRRRKTLTKDMVDALIDKIYVYGQYQLEIIFKFRDEYLYLMQEIERLKEERQ